MRGRRSAAPVTLPGRRGRLRRWLLSAWLPLCLAAAGCGAPPPLPELEVEPEGYYARGYYLGSQRNVKAFVTRLQYVSAMRGSVFVDVMILNEQRAPITLQLDYSRLRVGEREIVAEDAPAEPLAPGAIKRVRLRFRTFMKRSQMAPGRKLVLELRGIRDAAGRPIHFKVPLAVKQPAPPEAPAPDEQKAEGWQ